MKKMGKRVIALALMALMLFACACGNNTTVTPTSTPEPTQEAGTSTPTQAADTATTAPTSAPADTTSEPTIIRFGTHYVQEVDPYYQDEVTGEYVMAEAQREASIAALNAVKEKLNVEIQFVQYAGDTREVLLQSVMAGDPICEIAWMWGGSEGTILAQNILQQLDDYAYLFLEDEDTSFMLYDQLFGHYYFLGAPMRFYPRWPLVFNIDYIEAVDTLKDENGNTIYPTTLFEEGNWTWSVFKDYLAKIDAYYQGSSAPVNSDRRISAYQTDYRFAALSASYSNGGAVYGTNGLQVASTETKEAVAFIEELMDANLLTTDNYDDGYTPGWTWSGNNFSNGESVFTDIPDWYIGGATSAASNRNESIAMVPWPRPDDMAFDDEDYRQVMTASDSIGILKGVSKEKTELAIKTVQEYYRAYYTALGGTNTVAEYKEQYATKQAASLGLDIFHETIGDSVLSTFLYISKMAVSNDYSDLIGIRGKWDDIVMKSIYGIDGYASYDVAIEANMSIITNVTDEINVILSTTGAVDNIAPTLDRIAAKPFPFALGTDPATIDWTQFFTASDGVDGVIDVMTGTYDMSATDFSTIGTYTKGVIATVSDKAGNTKSSSYDVIIYDPNNTVAPTFTAKADYRDIVLDEDTSAISWSDFIETATDVHGFSLLARITADLSQLDTSTPGEYSVTLTVTDFAGNTATVTINVNVVAL